jgi:hypothetical protein
VGKFIQKIMGNSPRKGEARAIQDAANARRQQEGGQAAALQAAGQQQSQVDQGLGKARRSVRGRRLLLGDSAGKATIG